MLGFCKASQYEVDSFKIHHLECIGCCVVMAENHQPLGESRYAMLGKLLVDEVAGERLDGLEGEVDGVNDHPVLGEPHLELEGDLGPSAPSLCHLRYNS